MRSIIYKLILAAVLGFVLAGCSSEVDSSLNAAQTSGDWLIPVDQVFDGGPGKDGIPALSNPTMITAAQVTYLADNDLVIGVKLGNEIRAYPHPILDWHEIINDKIDQKSYSITYCPLTGSGICWNRTIDGAVSTFGVSGLLYNTNLIPYDRATNSNWSQMKLQCVNGTLKGREAELFPLVETTWKTWRTMYPTTLVVSRNTGFNRSYGTYPYGGYRTNSTLLFPIANDDTRLTRKERVMGVIIGEQTRAYRIGALPDTIGVINETVNNAPIVFAGSSSKNLAILYSRKLADNTVLTFTPVQNALPIIMIDNEGSSWDVNGLSVSGPRAGQQLVGERSYIAYWFAWGTFFTGATIWGL